MKIVLIEDEALAAEDLQFYLNQLLPTATILAVLPTVKDAVAFFNSTTEYDLIFADIHLGDGKSFDIFRQCTIVAPIIFCTAYNQYTLDAFQTNGIAYILKPYDKTAIEQALNKYDALKQQMGLTTDLAENITNLLATQPTKIQTLLVQQANRIIPLDIASIAIVQLKNKVVFVHTFDAKQFSVTYSLEELEGLLSSKFYRINRQHIVSRAAIKEVLHTSNRKLVIKVSLPFTDELVVGKEKITHFLDWLTRH